MICMNRIIYAENEQPDLKGGAVFAEISFEEIKAAANVNEKESSPPKFSMTAYNGGAMSFPGWRYPVVVDIQGIKVAAGSIPIRLQHDSGKGVGHTTKIDFNGGKKITASGVVSRSNGAADEVVNSAKKGFPWQASIGAAVHENEFVDEGKSAVVNGQSVKGPLNIVRKSTLFEISFVDLGADTSTSATVAAMSAHSEVKDMNFEKWLEAKGFKKAEIAADKLKELQAQYDAEQKAAVVVPPAP